MQPQELRNERPAWLERPFGVVQDTMMYSSRGAFREDSRCRPRLDISQI